MGPLNVTASSLNKIVLDLSDKITKNHISNITVINSQDLFFSFSNYRKEKLLVSLNPHHPFISLVKIDDPVGTRVGQLSDTLRKEVKDGYLLEISTLNNDRVVLMRYGYTNEYFDKEERQIIIELIPHRPNLILINKDGNISYATHYTDALNEHPILKGIKYEPLKNNGSIKDEPFDLGVFKKEAERYYIDAKRKRLDEQFKPVLTHIKSRIKTLNHKLEVLNKEMESANESLANRDIGQMILTYAGNEEELKAYIKENSISYDFSLSSGVNANKYFQKYKKAKRTIEMDEKELVKTKDEIDYLQTCLSQRRFMNEDDIIELANLLFPHKFKINSKKAPQTRLGEISVNGIRIFYGKNAKQNDFLTFKKANRDYVFIHVKDIHGSHVVIADPQPDNNTILTACESALLLSGQDCGEIQSAKIKDIKKGSFLGQAILTSYQSYNIKFVRENTRDLLKF